CARLNSVIFDFW
nr:immunoglobulin heavy chain junction region [Macaca mulatta]